MRPFVTSALAAAIAFAVLPTLPHSAEAKTGVLRCQMPDGTSVYTNKACGSMGAKAAPLPADVMARIARDQRHEAKVVALQNGIELAPDELASSESVAVAPSRRPLSRGCATSPEQLALDLQGSVAIGDVNRIAESFDWAGMGNKQAQMIMSRLEQLARRTVRDSEYFDATIGDGMLYADAGEMASDGSAGMMQVTFDAGNGDSIVDFEVRRDQGCYFLRY